MYGTHATQENLEIISYHLYSLYEGVLFTVCLLVSSMDNLCKQFGPRSGMTKCPALSVSKLYNTLMVFLKETFENGYFEERKSAVK